MNIKALKKSIIITSSILGIAVLGSIYPAFFNYFIVFLVFFMCAIFIYKFEDARSKQ